MKLDRITLPAAVYIGALAEIVQNIDAARKGCELHVDTRTGTVSVFKGEKLSLILPSGAAADVSEDQGDEDADPAGGAPKATRGRTRAPKNPPPVST
jgi:hypothetical protein